MPFPLTKGVLYMKVLKLIDDKLEEYLMVVLTVAMTALIFIQVVMRYVFHKNHAPLLFMIWLYSIVSTPK